MGVLRQRSCVLKGIDVANRETRKHSVDIDLSVILWKGFLHSCWYVEIRKSGPGDNILSARLNLIRHVASGTNQIDRLFLSSTS